jgi:hypothetical protein
MSDDRALEYLAKFLIEKSLTFTNFVHLLQLDTASIQKDFVDDIAVYGVRIEDAEALIARKDIFPNKETFKISALE